MKNWEGLAIIVLGGILVCFGISVLAERIGGRVMELKDYKTSELERELELRKVGDKIPKFLSDKDIISKIEGMKAFLARSMSESIETCIKPNEYEYTEKLIEMFYDSGEYWNWYNYIEWD